GRRAGPRGGTAGRVPGATRRQAAYHRSAGGELLQGEGSQIGRSGSIGKGAKVTTDSLPAEQADGGGGGSASETDDATVHSGTALSLWERWSRENERSPRRARWLAEA